MSPVPTAFVPELLVPIKAKEGSCYTSPPLLAGRWAAHRTRAGEAASWMESAPLPQQGRAQQVLQAGSRRARDLGHGSEGVGCF